MQLLRLPAVLSRTGLSRSALYALLSSKAFPSAVKLTPRAVAWSADEVDSWIRDRLGQRAA